MLTSRLLLTGMLSIVFETKEFTREHSRPNTDLLLNYDITESCTAR